MVVVNLQEDESPEKCGKVSVAASYVSRRQKYLCDSIVLHLPYSRSVPGSGRSRRSPEKVKKIWRYWGSNPRLLQYWVSYLQMKRTTTVLYPLHIFEIPIYYQYSVKQACRSKSRVRLILVLVHRVSDYSFAQKHTRTKSF
jgi:hypothetical protein